MNSITSRASCDAKNEVFNKSFFSFVTKIYNSLDLSLRNLPNIDDFKVNLKLKYKKKKIKHFQGVFLNQKQCM